MQNSHYALISIVAGVAIGYIFATSLNTLPFYNTVWNAF